MLYMSIDSIEIEGKRLSKDKINTKYEKPFRPPMIYSDGTEIEPFHCDMGYGFIETDKLMTLSSSDNGIEWMYVSDFGLENLPIKVEGVFRVNPDKKKAKLIGYNYYLLTDEYETINSPC